ncbi:MAG TPA: carotenoid 1,2-hydratase [Caldimonas sp.]|nr:carotenoid 1,2-hydratase [Caldimonas sp.]
MPSRRSILAAALLAPHLSHAAPGLPAQPGLVFPRDFGSHPETRIEWWYVTGSLEAAARRWGFQVTFFRAATGFADSASRFAAGDVLFAHAAITDLEPARIRFDQRIARPGFGIAEARPGDTSLRLRDWRLGRESASGPSRYHASVASERAAFAFELTFDATEPVLVQGQDGISRKGPAPAEFSHYYSEPQLAARGHVALDGRAHEVTGRAWLDHEWSDSFLAPDAVGWDWIGMNLDDGAALTAFQIRRADGTTLWAGGSHRPRGGPTRNFAPHEVTFEAERRWTSPATRAIYPVRSRIVTPAGRFVVAALLDDQEIDSRASSGAVYWEGLSDLLVAQGRRVGGGYLEMTGYVAPLVL